MAIDTAERRRAVSGIGGLLLPGVTPNAANDQEWRQEAGWGYPGILVITAAGSAAFVYLSDPPKPRPEKPEPPEKLVYAVALEAVDGKVYGDGAAAFAYAAAAAAAGLAPFVEAEAGLAFAYAPAPEPAEIDFEADHELLTVSRDDKRRRRMEQLAAVGVRF